MIITCRTAAQQYQFQGFAEVEISDFDQAQIAAFAQKWFITLNRNFEEKGLAKATQFIQQLQLAEARQIRELAVTPLLLHLTCAAFQNEVDFPTKRADFYKQGLDILLFRLDEVRGVQRHAIDCHLSLPQKIKLLSQIAAITFEQGCSFFEKSKLQQYIKNYICTLPGASSELETLEHESERLLKAIEVQHGLLVERSRGIYSFPHSTFQEYLTARYIISSYHPETSDQNLTQLITHASEPRWHTIFLLVANMLENGDRLLQLMQQHISRLMGGDGKLQQLLVWLAQKSLVVQAPYQLSATRAFYLALVLAREAPLAYHVRLALAIDPTLMDSLDPDLAFDLALERVLTLSLALTRNPTLDQATTLFFALPLEHCLTYNLELKSEAQRTDKSSAGIPQTELARLLLGESLQDLKNHLPNSAQGEESLKVWWRDHGKAWTEELRTIMIQYRDIGHCWKFDDQQWQILQQFYQANYCLIDCLNSECPVTPAVHRHIQEALLLPTG